MNINFIDLFAGAGGLSEGFVKEGFTPIAFIEKDMDACYTLKTRLAYWYLKETNNLNLYEKYLRNEISRTQLYENIPSSVLEKVIDMEINENTIDLIFNKIEKILGNEKIDIILGGPPCQTYSVLGRSVMKEKVINDNRNYLFKFYLRFLERYKPSIFLFENVVGLLSANNGDYFRNIISSFNEIGYTINYKILNASDYGVLQNRKRIIIIGTKSGINFVFPKPKPELISGITLKDIFYDLPKPSDKHSKEIFFYTKEINEYLKRTEIRNNFNFTTLHIVNKVNDIYKEIYRFAVKSLFEKNKQINYTELPDCLKTRKNQRFIKFRVLNPSGISTTILSKVTELLIYPDYENPRAISIRESARIQSFPDDYFFEGGKDSCFKQLGNAVPVLLAQELAKQIKQILNKNE